MCYFLLWHSVEKTVETAAILHPSTTPKNVNIWAIKSPGKCLIEGLSPAGTTATAVETSSDSESEESNIRAINER